MIRLPAALEKRLKALFSRAPDRQKFVNEVLEDAIEKEERKQAGGGQTLHLYTDGGSRGNPGKAAIGCVLIDPIENKVIETYKETIGIHTNNVAEYRALIRGLEMARKHSPSRLVCHMDSELIAKQASGEYRVKVATLQPLVEEVHQLAEHFADISYHYIPREQNTKADSLVNQALDGR